MLDPLKTLPDHFKNTCRHTSRLLLDLKSTFPPSFRCLPDQHDQPDLFSTSTSTRPDPTRPDPTRPDPTRPDPTRPDPTRPDPTRPDPTRPDPTRPDPTRPDPTRPDPTRPDPTRPDPTRPDPTRPDPTRPDPTSTRPLPDLYPTMYYRARQQQARYKTVVFCSVFS